MELAVTQEFYWMAVTEDIYCRCICGTYCFSSWGQIVYCWITVTVDIYCRNIFKPLIFLSRISQGVYFGYKWHKRFIVRRYVGPNYHWPGWSKVVNLWITVLVLHIATHRSVTDNKISALLMFSPDIYWWFISVYQK